jgi:hypothetical protein
MRPYAGVFPLGFLFFIRTRTRSAAHVVLVEIALHIRPLVAGMSSRCFKSILVVSDRILWRESGFFYQQPLGIVFKRQCPNSLTDLFSVFRVFCHIAMPPFRLQ